MKYCASGLINMNILSAREGTRIDVYNSFLCVLSRGIDISVRFAPFVTEILIGMRIQIVLKF